MRLPWGQGTAAARLAGRNYGGTMTQTRWRAVLFDLDGTIANTIPLIVASFRRTLGHYGLEVPDDATITSWIGRTLHDQFGRLVPASQVDAIVASYSKWQMEHLDAFLEPYDGVPELLSALAEAGIPAGIVTSKRRVPAQVTIEHLGLDRWLQVATAYEDTTRHKPHPAPLLHGAEALGFDRESTVYIGDAATDLVAAQAAGMDGIGVTWGAGLGASLAQAPSVAVVESVDDLSRLLLGSS